MESDNLPLLRVGGKARHPIVVNLTVDGKDIPMEIDTGAAVSLIPRSSCFHRMNY